jgi:hypothetical protein
MLHGHLSGTIHRLGVAGSMLSPCMLRRRAIQEEGLRHVCKDVLMRGLRQGWLLHLHAHRSLCQGPASSLVRPHRVMRTR